MYHVGRMRGGRMTEFGNLLGSKSWILGGGGFHGLYRCDKVLEILLEIIFGAKGR